MIGDCYKQFLENFKDVLKLPQVKMTKQQNEIYIYFESLSKSYVVNSPSVQITDNEVCAGFEKYRTVTITAHNCGLCKGTKSVTFDSRTIHKFMLSLGIVLELFKDNYNKAIEIDKDQLEWQQIVNFTKEAIGYNKRPKKEESTYMVHYLYNIDGTIDSDDMNKNFDIELNDLSAKQVEQIGKVLKNL